MEDWGWNSVQVLPRTQSFSLGDPCPPLYKQEKKDSTVIEGGWGGDSATKVLAVEV